MFYCLSKHRKRGDIQAGTEVGLCIWSLSRFLFYFIFYFFSLSLLYSIIALSIDGDDVFDGSRVYVAAHIGKARHTGGGGTTKASEWQQKYRNSIYFVCVWKWRKFEWP